MQTNTTNTHTPGPWRHEPLYAGGMSGPGGTHGPNQEDIVVGPSYEPVASIHAPESGEIDATGKANARLIAAAPDLLEAVHRSLAGMLTAITYMENDENATAADVDDVRMDLEAAYAAIAAATGDE